MPLYSTPFPNFSLLVLVISHYVTNHSKTKLFIVSHALESGTGEQALGGLCVGWLPYSASTVVIPQVKASEFSFGSSLCLC